MTPQHRQPAAHPQRTFKGNAFTLTELLVVMGLIAMLVTLLLPVITKARAASHSAKCLANMREMGHAWMMYTLGSRGALPPYFWRGRSVAEVEWNSHWISILDMHCVRGESTICPAAAEPSTDSARSGFGSVTTSWTGKYSSNFTPIRTTANVYRDGSYGFNRHMFSESGWGDDGMAKKLTAVPTRDMPYVPVFFDCVWIDAQPPNHGTGDINAPADPPPNLLGTTVKPGSGQDHWQFLISRHGRGINMAMADGSARWVQLEDTYTLKWRNKWKSYPIPLPSR